MAVYATLLRNSLRLTCRSVDRIFLQAYVPTLQTVGWACLPNPHSRGPTEVIEPQRHGGFAWTTTSSRLAASLTALRAVVRNGAQL
jgi:hypothetical protein